MQQIRIFKYPTRNTAVFVTGNERTYNMPIQNSKITLYKGANAPLDFNIFDADGKPLIYDGSGTHLELKVYDTHTQRIVFTKRLEAVEILTKQDKAGALMPSVKNNNYKKSVFRTVIEVTDTIDLIAGTQYRWVVMEQDLANNTGYFYSGLDHVVEGELHLKSTAAPMVEPSHALTDSSQWTRWTRVDVMDHAITGDNDNILAMGWTKYTSEAMQGDAQVNIMDGIHTMAFYATNFTGVVFIEGCIEAEVPDASSHYRWFNIPANGSVITNFNNHSGVEAVNFTGNFNWIRVVVYQMERPGLINGNLTRVLLRK